MRTARDKRQLDHSEAIHVPAAGTAVAGGRVALNATQTLRMGALFTYLIVGGPKPDNIAADASHRLALDASPRLAASPQRLINIALQIRDLLNEHRPEQPLESMEDVGYHLVRVAKVIGPEHVPRTRG
jgi:hypothetical protein